MFRTIRLVIWFAIVVLVVSYLLGSGTPIRKSRNKKIAGVCGGIAESLRMDPTVIRVIWVLFVMYAGSGILAYIVAAFIMPDSKY